MELGECTTLAPPRSLGVNYIKDHSKVCITPSEVEYVLKHVEEGTAVAPLSLKPSLEKKNPGSVESNPYEEVLLDKTQSKYPNDIQKELENLNAHWSILSTTPSFCDAYSNLSCTFVEAKAPRSMAKFLREEFVPSPLEFDQTLSDMTEEEFLDCYPDVEVDVHNTYHFDDSVDLSTTYLGTMDKDNQLVFNCVASVPLSPRSTASGCLPDQSPMTVLFDTGATKSFMPKSFYEKHEYLKTRPKLKCTTSGIVVGNGQVVETLFAIPIQVEIEKHRFEIITTVCAIHDQVDLVFGLKNMVEVEGLYDMRKSSFIFLGRSIPVFPEKAMDVKPGESALVKVKAPFCEEISSIALAKFFNGLAVDTLKLKLARNHGLVNCYNKSTEILSLKTNKPLGVIDLRSVGYFKVNYGDLLRKLDNAFDFKHLASLNPQPSDSNDVFLKAQVVNDSDDPYPWLEPDDPRRFQTDEEILEEKLDLSKSFLTPREKTRMLQMAI